MRNLQSWISISAAAEPVLSEATDQWVRAVDLPAGHRQVLLRLRGGELAKTILEHIREQSWPDVKRDDTRAAIEAGHIFWNSDKHRFELRPSGLWAVGDIMRDLARKFDIHILTRRAPARMSNQGPTIHCSCCGLVAYASRNSGDAVLGAHQVTHLAAVADAKARGVSYVAEREAKIAAIMNAVSEGRPVS